jgi:peptidoglycan/xylan/chitin deacetylase (PgdA/CDA1 family)
MYHRILADDEGDAGIEPGMFVRASTFAMHLDWLQSRYAIVTLGDALTAASRSDQRPKVVLTFDDGWRDNLEVAWPILDREGVRATIFLVSEWCSTGANGAGRFLSPDEIRDLANAGMEFGAHTVSHPHLSRIDERLAMNEMRISKDAVAAWTGRPCDLFAYPYGDHHEGTVALAREMFRASVVVAGGWWHAESDAARIPRIGIHQDMSSDRALFEARLAGLV